MDCLFKLVLDHVHVECEVQGDRNHVYASIIQAFFKHPDLEHVVKVAVEMTDIVSAIPPLKEAALQIPTGEARFLLISDDDTTSIDLSGTPLDLNNLLVKSLLAADQIKVIFRDALRLKGEYAKHIDASPAGGDIDHDADKKAMKQDLKGRKN